MSAPGHNLQEFARDLAQVTKDFVKGKLAPLEEEIIALKAENIALRAEMTALKERGIKFCGVWEQGTTYNVGDVVSDKGMWVCMSRTKMRPGESRDWQLGIRNGRDGKDLRNGS